jgi:hypothetical protein
MALSSGNFPSDDALLLFADPSNGYQRGTNAGKRYLAMGKERLSKRRAFRRITGDWRHYRSVRRDIHDDD